MKDSLDPPVHQAITHTWVAAIAWLLEAHSHLNKLARQARGLHTLLAFVYAGDVVHHVLG